MRKQKRKFVVQVKELKLLLWAVNVAMKRGVFRLA